MTVERVEGKGLIWLGGKEKKIARTRVHPVPQICTFVELRVVDTCFKINISGCF